MTAEEHHGPPIHQDDHGMLQLRVVQGGGHGRIKPPAEFSMKANPHMQGKRLLVSKRLRGDAQVKLSEHGIDGTERSGHALGYCNPDGRRVQRIDFGRLKRLVAGAPVDCTRIVHPMQQGLALRFVARTMLVLPHTATRRTQQHGELSGFAKTMGMGQVRLHV